MKRRLWTFIQVILVILFFSIFFAPVSKFASLIHFFIYQSAITATGFCTLLLSYVKSASFLFSWIIITLGFPIKICVVSAFFNLDNIHITESESLCLKAFSSAKVHYIMKFHKMFRQFQLHQKVTFEDFLSISCDNDT